MNATANWGQLGIVCGVLLVLGLVGGNAARIAKWAGILLLAVFALGWLGGYVKAEQTGITVTNIAKGSIGGTS